MTQNYQLGSSIEKALFKQFRRVTLETVLGLVSRILETDEFVVVVDEVDHPISIITHLDLLEFVANDSHAVNAALKMNGSISNGTTNGDHATNAHANGYANGHSNGYANGKQTNSGNNTNGEALNLTTNGH